MKHLMGKEKEDNYVYIGNRLEYVRKEIVKKSQKEFAKSFNKWMRSEALVQAKVSSMESQFSIGKELFLDIVIFLFEKYRINPLWFILKDNANQLIRITNIDGNLHEKRRIIEESCKQISQAISDIDIILRNNPQDT